MRRSAVGSLVFGLALVGAGGSVPRAASPQTQPVQAARPAAVSSPHQATIDQYCVACHNRRLKTGDLVLEGLDPANVAADAETWEKVVRKLRLGVMPPQGARRPDQPTYDRLIGFLEEQLDSVPSVRLNPGRPVLRRLNRAEYANAIRDLLGMDVDVTSFLPPDDSAYGFDNVADAQGSSPANVRMLNASLRDPRR